MSTKIIDKKISSFITNQGKLKALGHEIALMIFDHAYEHSDCTRAIKLCKAMPNSWQPQLVAWFKAFSPVIVVVKNDKCELSAAFKAATAPNKPSFWDRVAASETPFFDLTEEPTLDKEYDLAALLKMVERLSAVITKKIDDGKVKVEDIETARSLATAIAGVKVQRVRANEMIATPANTDEGVTALVQAA